jgi:hypothetical protein
MYHVGETTERLKASGSDDGGLNLAVDVFSHGIAGPRRLTARIPDRWALRVLPKRLKDSRQLHLAQEIQDRNKGSASSPVRQR